MKQRSFLLYFFFYVVFLNTPFLFAGNRSLNVRSNTKQTIQSANLAQNNSEIPTILANLKELVDQQQYLIEHIDNDSSECLTLVDENIRDICEIIIILQSRDDIDSNSLEEIANIQNSIEKLTTPLTRNVAENMKAPRPNSPSANANDAVVGKSTCDLTQVLALLSTIKKRIDQLQEIICRKFQETWTILADIKETITEEFFDTRTILCDKFNGTFTMLEQIEQEIIDTRTILCDKFNGTFTELQQIDIDIIDTRTILCDKFNGTFTELEQIEQEIIDTRTILCDKFNGTFTELQQIDIDIIDTRTILCDKFNGTFTVLEEIQDDIFDTQTILCDKFNGTFTTLQNIETDISGIFTAIADIDVSVTIGDLTVTAIVDLSGVFTVLEDICEKIEGTFTVLEDIEEDIFDTRTILCDKFEQTWTILGEISEDIFNLFNFITNLEGTVTGDIFDTQTILCDKFNGTFTTLENICNKIENLDIDISGVFTVLEEVQEDIFDTRTILCDKFNGTFTTLENIEIDISGIFTAIDGIDVTATVDLSGVFTVLNFICEKIEDNDDLILSALCTPSAISQSDVGLTTFTISSAGFYVFAEDIVFSPASGQPAIEITSNEVTIDMCNKSLTQGNATSGVIGFRVQGGTAGSPRISVKIFNGTIGKFTQLGVSVGPNAISPGDNACERILLENLKFGSCPTNVIEFRGTSTSVAVQTSEIKDCVLVDCCTAAGQDRAITYTNCSTSAIKNTLIDRCGGGSVNFTGVKISDSKKCGLDKVTVSCCLGLTFSGLLLDTSQKSMINKCVVQGNDTTGYLGGIVESGVTERGDRMEKCLVSYNDSDDGPLFGYDLLPGSSRIIIVNCEASNNLVTGVLSNSHCVGFNFDQVFSCIVNNCKASFNNATGNGGTNYAAGFNIGSSAPPGPTGVKNSQFFRNFATRNNGPTDDFSFGFRTIAGTSMMVPGNENNAIMANAGILNGPVTPDNLRQIVQRTGSFSSPGGVANASIQDSTIDNLNGSEFEYSNIRIVQ